MYLYKRHPALLGFLGAPDMRQIFEGMEELIKYRYAELNTAGKRWYVYFYAFNPASGKLERKRIYVNRARTRETKIRYAKKLIDTVNGRLDQGWNPFILEKDLKQYTHLLRTLDLMLNYKLAYLRESSKANYISRIRKLKKWIKQRGKEKMFVFEFDESMAIDFMNNLLMIEKIKGRTYNNHLIDYRSFFNLMIKHKYITSNPFHAVDRMPEESKVKQPFSEDQQKLYKDYIKENDYDFYIISQYCYYCALRPNEIVQLKVKNFDLKKGLVFVPAHISKNRKDRIIPIANVFLQELKKYFTDTDANHFICAYGFLPGKSKIFSTRIAEHFRRIANKIGLPKDVYFYSLKDTVAGNLMDAGFSAKDIRDLFGHSSIAVTDNYLRRRNAYLNEKLRTNFPEF